MIVTNDAIRDEWLGLIAIIVESPPLTKTAISGSLVGHERSFNDHSHVYPPIVNGHWSHSYISAILVVREVWGWFYIAFLWFSLGP